jgi:aspartate carbamoyltransferase catalytic subunit
MINMSMKGKDFINFQDFTKSEVDRIFDLTKKYVPVHMNSEKLDVAEGKILANLFCEPSTRTKFAFEAAILRLGGDHIGWAGIDTTSYKKGESFLDGMRQVDRFADAICLRHEENGAPAATANVCEHPVINCGDGTNQHPTQPLHEMYAMREYKGKLKGLNVVFMGDLKNMRVAHSLAYGLAMYEANQIYVSPPELAMPSEIVNDIKKKYGAKISLMTPEEALPQADVLYTIAMEIKRFIQGGLGEEGFKKFSKYYKVNMESLKRWRVKDDLAIIHCLPRLGELDPDVDGSKYDKVFETYNYAIPAKMALLALMLGVEK